MGVAMKLVALALCALPTLSWGVGPLPGAAGKYGKHGRRVPPVSAPTTATVQITGTDLQIAGLWDTHPTSVVTSPLVPDGQASFEVSSWHAASYNKAAILRVLNWPAAVSGKTIVGVTIDLYRTQGYTAADPSTPTISARQVLQSVVMSQVTWNSFATGSAWATAGARGALDVDTAATVGSVSVANTVGTKTIASSAGLVTLFNGWKNLTITNNGLLLYPSNFADYHTFSGPTGANPPVITIEYNL